MSRGAGRRRDRPAIVCDRAGVSRKLLLLVLVDPRCQGPNLDGLAEALVLAAIVLLAVAALGMYVLVRVWTGLIRALRAALAAEGRAGPAERAWWYALVASGLHVAAAALVVDDGPLGLPVTVGLTTIAATALLLLLGAAALAWRRGLRWPLPFTGALLAVTLVSRWYELAQRPPRELPGRIVEVVASNTNACARLSTGEVACVGSGPRGDGRESRFDGPTLVADIDDATGLALTGEVACALRREHPVTCWGGGATLPVPGPPQLPWTLPDAGVAVALAVADHQIVALGGDGALRGWPTSAPIGRARLLAGDEAFGRAWLCAADMRLSCWQPGRPGEPVHFEVPAVEQFAVEADGEVVCARAAAGAVHCFDLYRKLPLAPRQIPGLRELVALADHGRFCGHDDERRVHCWEREEPTHRLEELTDVDGIIAVGGRLCGERGEQRTCVAPFADHDLYGGLLLEYDRAP